MAVDRGQFEESWVMYNLDALETCKVNNFMAVRDLSNAEVDYTEIRLVAARSSGSGDGGSSKGNERAKAAGFGAIVGGASGVAVSVAKELISGNRNAGNIIANAALSGASGAALGAATGGITGNKTAAGIAAAGGGAIMGGTALSNKAVDGLANLFKKKGT